MCEWNLACVLVYSQNSDQVEFWWMPMACLRDKFSWVIFPKTLECFVSNFSWGKLVRWKQLWVGQPLMYIDIIPIYFSQSHWYRSPGRQQNQLVLFQKNNVRKLNIWSRLNDKLGTFLSQKELSMTAVRHHYREKGEGWLNWLMLIMSCDILEN